MERTYTDPRFPGIEVRNSGRAHFTVFFDGNEHETFTMQAGSPIVDEESARRRAKAYFDRMAEGRASAELEDRTNALDRKPDNPQTPGVMSNKPVSTMSAGQLLAQGGGELTWDMLIDLGRWAQTIQDPAEKAKALEQIRQMGAQMEDAPNEIVRRLLD